MNQPVSDVDDPRPFDHTRDIHYAISEEDMREITDIADALTTLRHLCGYCRAEHMMVSDIEPILKLMAERLEVVTDRRVAVFPRAA